MQRSYHLCVLASFAVILASRFLAAGEPIEIPDEIRLRIENRVVKVAPQTFPKKFHADGLKNEGGWEDAYPIEHFTAEGGKMLAGFQTRVLLLWDSTALYLFADMPDDPDLTPVAFETTHDGNMFGDDCFEFFILPESEARYGKTYFQFAVNVVGYHFDCRNGNAEWDSTLEAKTRILPEGGWSVELRIPFSDIGVVPEAGDVWRVNMGRHRAVKPYSAFDETSSIIKSASHHDLAQYVPMRFLSEPAQGNRGKGQDSRSRPIPAGE